MIEARGVSVTYRGSAQPVLDDVSVTLAAGHVMAVVGPNGAGKSTLLRLLAGVLVPTRGEVHLDQKPMTQMRRRDIAQRLAYVPQDSPTDVPFTVADVVLTGRHPHLGPLAMEARRDHEAARAAMEAMSVTHLEARRLDTLSGGERQRVLVARALAAEPAVLLLDEPAAHLDLGHRADLGARLVGLAADRDVAVMVVHHDLNLAADTCAEICLLAAGRVLALGPRAEVLTAQYLERAYDWPVEVDTNPLTGAPRVTARPDRG